MTLHVGLGTFRPVKVEDVTEHHMHSEFYMVDAEAAEKINKAKEHGDVYKRQEYSVLMKWMQHILHPSIRLKVL